MHRYGTHNMRKEFKDRRLYFVIRITFFVFDDIRLNLRFKTFYCCLLTNYYKSTHKLLEAE